MDYSYKLACAKDNLKDVRDFIHDVLSPYPISENEKNMLILAVDEVCSNIIIHTHKNNPEEFIIVNIKFFNNSIMFEIIDFGGNFNLLNYKESSVSQIIRGRKKGGLGIMLVKKIMDEIEVSNLPSYNVCRLYKKLG